MLLWLHAATYGVEYELHILCVLGEYYTQTTHTHFGVPFVVLLVSCYFTWTHTIVVVISARTHTALAGNQRAYRMKQLYHFCQFNFLVFHFVVGFIIISGFCLSCETTNIRCESREDFSILGFEVSATGLVTFSYIHTLIEKITYDDANDDKRRWQTQTYNEVILFPNCV